VTAYYNISEVEALPQFRNSGPPGWCITFDATLLDDQAPHRQLLESFAASYPEARLNLPDYHRYEDCIEGSMQWAGKEIWIWYETILSYLALWCSDREAADSLHKAIVPMAAAI